MRRRDEIWKVLVCLLFSFLICFVLIHHLGMDSLLFCSAPGGNKDVWISTCLSVGSGCLLKLPRHEPELGCVSYCVVLCWNVLYAIYLLPTTYLPIYPRYLYFIFTYMWYVSHWDRFFEILQAFAMAVWVMFSKKKKPHPFSYQPMSDGLGHTVFLQYDHSLMMKHHVELTKSLF